MNITDGLFITCCILSLLIIIALTVFAVVEFKKESAIKNPYYWCDGDWTCCAFGNDNCDASKSKVLEPKSDPVYFPADRVKEGSAYHQNCILPIKNAILNYNGSQDFNFGYIYSNIGSTGANNPSVYAPGCTGAGPAGGPAHCADPKVNPQSAIGTYSCGYASFDSPPAGNVGNSYDPTSNTLNTGHSGYNGATFNSSKWVSNPATPYIAGITNNDPNNVGNGFNFPYSNVSGSFKGQYTGGPGGGSNGVFAGGNTWNNAFYNLGPTGNVY